MNKQQKIERIDRYDSVINPDGYAILAEFNKISVSDMEAFRRELTEVGCTAVTIKNTLAKLVFEKKGLEAVCEYLLGPSILFCGDEEIAPAAKLLAKFAKKHRGLIIKTIVYDNNVFPKEDFKTFTSMPTKDEVRSKLLSVIKAPQSNFVRVIGAASRVVGVINAYADKKAG